MNASLDTFSTYGIAVSSLLIGSSSTQVYTSTSYNKTKNLTSYDVKVLKDGDDLGDMNFFCTWMARKSQEPGVVGNGKWTCVKCLCPR
ncbi:hypothetical protein Tcan_10253 [Toxocara canis]|uniref:Uncharacterized protein n=1 Tax=Toxocara canis TaxID=6265 RepID=A0A0B2UN55_TOXCA|nr:hypothetical protein Tcan_10253 [Toxocara canis]